MSFSEDAESVSWREFQDLCYHIGLALVTWQELEESHFSLFFKMVGARDYEIGSVIYHHIESFQTRHTMLGYIAQIYLKDKPDQRQVWENNSGGLKKEIKDANENRNKLAHYAEDVDLGEMITQPDGSVSFPVSNPSLRPGRHNTISRLLGRTADKPEHNLGVTEIRDLIKAFRELTKKIDDFRLSLPVPPGAHPVQQLGLPPPRLQILKDSPSKHGKEDGDPSES